MQTQLAKSDISIQEKVNRIEELNLEPIMVKLMDTDEGEGWTLEQTLEAEKWYKRFLILNLKYPDQSIVPNKQVDTFWHYHILDTMKYEEDCRNTFGYFLHHFPYFGMRSQDDAKNLQTAFAQTQILFNEEFSEPLKNLADLFFVENKSAICDDEGGNCQGSGCQSQKCGPNSNHDRPTLASVLHN
jgi:hypothetical protein